MLKESPTRGLPAVCVLKARAFTVVLQAVAFVAVCVAAHKHCHQPSVLALPATAWTTQNLIVDGSPRWEVYRTVPVEAAQAAADASAAPGTAAPSAVLSVRHSFI